MNPLDLDIKAVVERYPRCTITHLRERFIYVDAVDMSLALMTLINRGELILTPDRRLELPGGE